MQLDQIGSNGSELGNSKDQKTSFSFSGLRAIALKLNQNTESLCAIDV